MRVLLDTNIFVYMATAPDYLSRDALAILYDTDTVLFYMIQTPCSA